MSSFLCGVVRRKITVSPKPLRFSKRTARSKRPNSTGLVPLRRTVSSAFAVAGGRTARRTADEGDTLAASIGGPLTPSPGTVDVTEIRHVRFSSRGFFRQSPVHGAWTWSSGRPSRARAGGPNRARILQALDERPRNPNQLADDLDLAYNTIRHHLEVLERNEIVASSDADYGTVYMPSDRAREHWNTVEEIMSQVGG